MTVVAAGLIRRSGRIFICRRRADQLHPGKWEFPGGKVERGESPSEALVRELREELAIEAADLRECLRYDFSYPGKPPIRLVFFAVGRYRGRIDASQFAEARWEARGGLTDLDFLEGDERIVRDLAEGRI